MNMKKQFSLICGLVLSLSACSVKQAQYKFQDPDLSVDERVSDLISQLTIEEKISQMMNNAPAIERLGIPAYNWWNEALHGVARSPYPATSFPQAIAMAATWDTASIHQMAEYVSDEGRAIYHDATKKGQTGIFLGLTYWTPNINIFRDPRWGRGQETYGEDPFLTGAIGASFVRGLQGDDPRYLKASACAKHFAVHSGPEWNRHTYNAEVSNFDLWDTYLPAFKELIVDANVSGVMCAYNAYFGQPCCGNDVLMMDILKKQWNFEGYVTSDCGAIDDFYRTHQTHPDAAAASAAAVLHGTDCECGSSYQALADALGNGLITEEDLDASLKRLFRIRFLLGMFDPDDRVPYAATPLSVLESSEHKAHALKMAQQSIVLLKNKQNLLPLNKGQLKKIAVTGPNADSESVLLANYYGYPTEITTLLEGIRAKVGSEVDVIYDKGVNLTDDYVFASEYDDRFFSYDGKPGFKAEYYQNLERKGAPGLSRIEKKVDYKWGDGQHITDSIITRRLSASWSTVFTPDETKEVCFELKADDWAELYIDGVKQEKTGAINAYYPLKAEKGKSYKIDIYYRQFADNAEISFDLGTLRRARPADVAASLKEADVIIFAGGISAKVEGEEMGVVIDGFKRGDRTSIDLPAVQKELLKELVATGKPVVFVLMTGSALGLEWESENVPAILNAWYGGQAGGQAIADVLFGDYNPAGRLPVTFYRSVDDLPDFEDYSMTNRTYRYFKGTPIYPFGYGLSYTTFNYGKLSVGPLGEQSLRVKTTVSNIGDREGDEVVQLYVSNQRDFVTPLRALKGFKRIHLKAGESQTVEFTLKPEDLSVVNSAGHPVPMAGEVIVSVGGGQAPTLSATIFLGAV
jgi:beta-glucosidase